MPTRFSSKYPVNFAAACAPAGARPRVWVAQGWWMEEIYAGIAAVAAEQGWRLDERMRWHRGAPLPVPEQPAGVIVFTGDCAPLIEAVRGFVAAGVPVVDIETHGDHYGAPKVLSYDEDIGERAARHLAGLNPAALVFLSPRSPGAITRARLAGFRAGAARCALPVRVVEPGDFDPRDRPAGGRIGVFAPDDPLAREALHLCLDTGVRVPEEVAVLGADDDRTLCECAPVPLSSVNMGFAAKGRAAAELLGRLMRGEPRPAGPVVVPIAGVTVRASTAAPAAGHPELDRLLRHLRENAHRPECLDTLYAECGIAERTAHHLFRSHLGTRPLAVLSGIRLGLARRFAADRRLTREAVARAAGFSGLSALVRAERAAGRA